MRLDRSFTKKLLLSDNFGDYEDECVHMKLYNIFDYGRVWIPDILKYYLDEIHISKFVQRMIKTFALYVQRNQWYCKWKSIEEIIFSAHAKSKFM